MDVDDLRVYQLAMGLGEEVWKTINNWSHFHKDTIGKQLVRSVDSVAANISEGFGRYHFKEAKHFYYYSRGSLYETKTWLNKAKNRGLITEQQFTDFESTIKVISIKLNNYIKSIGLKQKNTPS